DGDEGLFIAYNEVSFHAPLYAGDYVEVRAEIIKVGNTSRKMKFEAYKVIEGNSDPLFPTRARVLDPPLLVTSAEGTCVVPKI
ncbi:MAG: hotdog domain-containing protein, partial [Bacilli bacterium]